MNALTLAFHGCDHAVAETILAGNEHLKHSQNLYDWLGTGIYFWENSPARALAYAQRPANPAHRIANPAAIGVILDVGYCLDLLDAQFITVVREGYETLLQASKAAHVALPKNRTPKGSHEMLLRDLDCAVINMVHKTRENRLLRPFDSVRAAFIEGSPIYPGSGFHERNHIQICIRNVRCIKGYFRPLPHADFSNSILTR